MRTLPLLRRSVAVAVGRFRCCLIGGAIASGCFATDTDPVRSLDAHAGSGGNPSNAQRKTTYDPKAGNTSLTDVVSTSGEGGTASGTASHVNAASVAMPFDGSVIVTDPTEAIAGAAGGTGGAPLAMGGEAGNTLGYGGSSFVDSQSIGGTSSFSGPSAGGALSNSEQSAGGTNASSETSAGGQSGLVNTSSTVAQGTTPPRCIGVTPAARGCVAPRAIMGAKNAWGIALDETHAYVTSRLSQTGRVLRAPLASGPTETIAEAQTMPIDIVVASGRVFWCTADATGYVRMANVEGGLVETLAQGTTSGVRAVNADETHAYYLTNYNVVMSVSIVDLKTRVLSEGPYNSSINDMTLVDDTLVFTNSGIWSADFTRTEPETASISMVDVTGTPPPSALVSRLNYPQFWVSANAQYVFFNNDKAIYRVDRITGETRALVGFANETGATSPVVDLTADETYLYFSDGFDIYRIPVQGGQAEQISWGWQAVAHLAVNSTTIAWTDAKGGLVVAMSKFF